MKNIVKKSIVVGGCVLALNGGLITQTNALETTKIKSDVTIRVGEYLNKSGKRLELEDDNFNIGVPIREENGIYSVREYDLNYKLANEITKYLESKGVDVILQDTDDKSEDLNGAGRKAKQNNSKIYLSIHHNSWKEDSSGYFFMTNEGDYQSAKYAKDMSNAMSSNPMLIPQMSNRGNVDNYIGELNQQPAPISILGEFGFFSNPSEIKKCASDEQCEFIAERIGNEIIKILDEINN